MSDAAIQKILEVLQQTGGEGFRMAAEYTYSKALCLSIGMGVVFLFALLFWFLLYLTWRKGIAIAKLSVLDPVRVEYGDNSASMFFLFLVATFLTVIAVGVIAKSAPMVLSPEGATIMQMLGR